MNCWGWGTHKKYWKKLIVDPNFFLKKFSNKNIDKFTLNGKLNNWSQLINNHKKIIKTWAIYWNATIFYNKAFCLNPALSYTKNIGFGGNSTHTKKSLPQLKILNKCKKTNFLINQKKDTFFINKVYLHLNNDKKKFLKSLKYKMLSFFK